MSSESSHAVAALAALILGSIQFARIKGTSSHKVFGWAWVVLMLYVVSSGLFIYEIHVIGRYSPIHILSIVTIVSLGAGILAVRRHRVSVHKRIMTALFVFALAVTGLFTPFPGRVMHNVVF